MVKKIISFLCSFLLLFSLIPCDVFADDVLDVCPNCGERTYSTWRDVSISVSEALGLPFSIKAKSCSKCHYQYYDWNLFGFADYHDYVGDESLIINYLRQWADKILGKDASASKFEAGGGSASPGGVGRHPSGYVDDNGTSSIGQSGKLQMVLQPIGIFHSSYSKSSGFLKSVDLSNDFYSGTSFSGTYNKASVQAVYQFSAPCDGIYFTGSSSSDQTLLTGSIFINNWIELKSVVFKSSSSGYGWNITANKGDTIYLVSTSTSSYFKYNGSTNTWIGYAYRYNVYPLRIQVEPLTSTVVNQNSITINNNTLTVPIN